MANAVDIIRYKTVEKSACPGWDVTRTVALRRGPATSPVSGLIYLMPAFVDLKENLKDAGRIGHLQKVIVVSAGVNMASGNIADVPQEAMAEANLMAYIYSMFKQGGKYDYQRTPCGEFVRQYTPFASFHFGLFMAAAKFPLVITLAGAGYYNFKHGRPDDRAGIFGNARENEANLRYGYEVYERDLLA